jgi:dTDP-4-dehydrorhamnose 3,5-epimerase
MPFQFERLEIPEVVLIRTRQRGDLRGFFRETFKRSEFEAYGIPTGFVQDNHSRSAHGVLRGLHYQKQPHAQGKLLFVATGEIFDVAVDIRKGSPTFAHWVSQKLSAENGCMLWVPPGFAHGFCVLSDSADLIYKVTAEYSAESERGIIWNDPEIAIQWPMSKPSLSARDAQLVSLRDADINFVFG